MRGFYTVHTPEQFATWMADQQARLQPAPPAPDAAAAEDVAAEEQAGAEAEGEQADDAQVEGEPAGGEEQHPASDALGTESGHDH